MIIIFCLRKYPEGWTKDANRDTSLEYRLSIYHASHDDSGTFACITPTRHTHSVEIVVKGKLLYSKRMNLKSQCCFLFLLFIRSNRTCVFLAVHCPAIQSKKGLIMNTKETKMSTDVQFVCSNGNALSGSDFVTCLPSGNWSAPLPTCESE